jgi:hypothetical protein
MPSEMQYQLVLLLQKTWLGKCHISTVRIKQNFQVSHRQEILINLLKLARYHVKPFRIRRVYLALVEVAGYLRTLFES